MARQSNPRLNNPSMFSRSNRMKSAEERLRELEELTKKDRGGFSTFAEDTGAELGYIVPGAMFRGSSPIETAGNTKFFNVNKPQYPTIPETEEYQDEFNYAPDDEEIDTKSAEGFFNQVARSLYSPLPIYNSGQGIVQLQKQYQDLGMAYPVASNVDGTILWSDGSSRSASSLQIEPIQSLVDGNVLWSDGLVRPGIPDFAVNALSGTDALSKGLFGRVQYITQPYGNKNSRYDNISGGVNMGTDFRTRDLELRQIKNLFDMPLEVVESYSQAEPGSGWAGNMENRGYGNSLLLKFPNGSMIRVSHLDMNPWQVGDIINPGEVLGVPGATGNVTGEHADVEVYSPEGKIVSPDQFFAQVREMSPQLREPLYRIENNQPVYFSTPVPKTNQPKQQEQQQQIQLQSPLLTKIKEARQAGGNLIESIVEAPEIVGQAYQSKPIQQSAKMIGKAIAPTIEKINPTGEFDAGVTEGFITPEASQKRLDTVKKSQPSRGFLGRARQSLGNLAETIGDVTGIPEGTFSEFLAGGDTRRTNQALASEIAQAQGRQPGQSLGIMDGIKGIGKNLKTNVANAFNKFNPEQDIENNELDPLDFEAGAGVQRMKRGESTNGGVGANLFSRVQPKNIAGSRIVGQSGGENLLSQAPTIDQARLKATKDTTDPFFFTPLFDRVRGMTKFENGKPGRDQALSMDIFKDEFYQNPKQVSSVFGDTFMADEASKKATEYIKNQYRQKYSGSEYDQSDVERIIKSLPDQLNYTPKLPEPKKIQRKKPSLSDYLSQGKTEAQWFAETGRQNTLDQIRKSGGDTKQKVRNYALVSAGAPVYTKKGSALRVNILPNGQIVSGGQTLITGERVGGMTHDPSSLRTQKPKNLSKAPKQPKRSGPYVFDRAKSFVRGIFNRFFN